MNTCNLNISSLLAKITPCMSVFTKASTSDRPAACAIEAVSEVVTGLKQRLSSRKKKN